MAREASRSLFHNTYSSDLDEAGTENHTLPKKESPKKESPKNLERIKKAAIIIVD